MLICNWPTQQHQKTKNKTLLIIVICVEFFLISSPVSSVFSWWKSTKYKPEVSFGVSRPKLQTLFSRYLAQVMAHSGSKVLSFKCGNLEIKEIKQVREFAEELVKETEEIIANVIPAKILFLDNMCKSDLFKIKIKSDAGCEFDIPRNGLMKCPNAFDITGQLTDGEVTNSSKKRKLEGNPAEKLLSVSVPVNSHLTPLIDALKPEIQELIKTCSRVQIWIQLLIPKIEDGNNFGVSIQEEILNEVNRIQTEATGYLDQISRYYITRGKLLSKVAKYPYLDDYRQTIKEVDEKEIASLQMNGCELRNHYLLLLDSISKNYEKIKRPRSCNTDSMY